MVGLFYRKNTIVGEVPWGVWGVEGVPSSCALLAPSFTTCRYQTFFYFFFKFFKFFNLTLFWGRKKKIETLF
jgi:hypothetical protein